MKLSVDNLMTFPWIRERVEAGTLRLQGAHFDIRSGALSILGADGQFSVVPAQPNLDGALG